MYCARRMSWFLLLFDKHFLNYLQMRYKLLTKCSNAMVSICKGQMKMVECFLHKEFLLYFCKCKWDRENGHLLTKISNFVQFSNKKHLLQCKVKYNDETIIIQDG